MKRILSPTPVAFLALTVLSCGEPDFERPDRGEQVEAAHRAYSPALFDSITWSDELARARAGTEVFASRCRNCHGTLGLGATAYAAERGLTVPSLVTSDWPLGVSIDSVRHRIFVGHEFGMPTWGVAGISAREIDGAAFYLLERLRPEMLQN